MRKSLVACALAAFLLAACAGEELATPTAPPLPVLDDADLAKAVLTSEDVGEGWTKDEDAATNTVQIGGSVGAANVTGTLAQSTVSFKQLPGAGSASVTNSVFLTAGEDIARSIMQAHENAAAKPTWSQDREDGGKATFKNTGLVEGLASFGDDDFNARLVVNIKDAEGNETERTVEYLVYRDGALLVFIAAQDAEVEAFATNQARRLDDVLAGAATATPR
jgi:hypothetical protein